MNSKFLLENKYILVNSNLSNYRVIDYGTKIIICEVGDDVGFFTLNLTFNKINKNDIEEDVKPGDVYHMIKYQFFSDSEDRIQEIEVYDRIEGRLNSVLESLRESQKYKESEEFRRSLDISIICEDVSHLKEFFVY